MKEIKDLAQSLTAALASKRITISHGQALDVLAKLNGTKDWNAFNAARQVRLRTLLLRRALTGMLDMASKLAKDAGDAPEWNDGGFAREACKAARAALSKQPAAEPLDGAVDYEMVKGAESLWVGVDNISVYVRRADEGVAVDLFPKGQEDANSMAGTWALFAEAEVDGDGPAVASPPEKQPCVECGLPTLVDDDGLCNICHDRQETAPAPADGGRGWVIFSAAEQAADSGSGFWSNETGWGSRASATEFTEDEARTLVLPLSAGSDACWVSPETPLRDTGLQPEFEARARHVRQVYDLIASASAWQVDDSPVITSKSQDDLRADPENQVFYFTWTDTEDQLYSETLTESDLASAVIQHDGTLSFQDADGGPMTLRCFTLVPVSPAKQERSGQPHICGQDGEHSEGCDVCEEVRICARDLVAEWVGQHYRVNFDAESPAKRDVWFARFMDEHRDDNPLFPRQDWEYQVSNGDTRLGYADWLIHELEIQHEDREMGMLDNDDE